MNSENPRTRLSLGLYDAVVGRMDGWTPSSEIISLVPPPQGGSITALTTLCVRLKRKWKIGIFPPQHPFSPDIIISDKLFGDWPLSSFTFDVYLGTS